LTSNYSKFAPSTDPSITANRFMAWAHYYFGDPLLPNNYLLYKKTARIHHEIVGAFAQRKLRTLITAPRGYAKTTWCRLWVIYCVCYAIEKFIVFVSKPGQGSKNGRFVRNRLASNTKLHEDYGNLIPDTTKAKKNTEKRKDNDDVLTLTNGVVVEFNTIEGSIHGSSDLFRPTLIVCEDLQAEKHMKEPSSLDSHWDLFQHDVIFALDATYGKIIVIGNNYGKGSIVGNIMGEVEKELSDHRNPSWYVVNLDVFDSKGRSTWEDMFSTDKLVSDRELYKFHGKSDVFDSQRRNIPNDAVRKSIDGYLFHNCSMEILNGYTYLISEEYPHPLRCNMVACIDPAFSMSSTSDKRAKVIMAKAKFPKTKDIYVNGVFVMEYNYDHSNPAEIPDWIMNKHKKWKLSDMVIEANGGQIIFKYLNDKKFVDDVDYNRNPFNSRYIKYVDQNKGDRIWNSLTLKCKYGQFLIKRSMSDLIEECDNFGYHIKRREIHLLDAIQFGDAYTTTPETETAPKSQKLILPRYVGQEPLESHRSELIKKYGHRSLLLM
jgi:hypothetical protein